MEIENIENATGLIDEAVERLRTKARSGQQMSEKDLVRLGEAVGAIKEAITGVEIYHTYFVNVAEERKVLVA